MLKSMLSFIAIILVISFAAFASAPAPSGNVKGDWNVTFTIAGQSVDGTISLDVNGKTLTGTVFSEHTGRGTITDGTFNDNKLNCTLKFEKHESIALKGEFKDDKLSGTFDTEGMTGTWTAVRKK
jgi:hypothetical protein